MCRNILFADVPKGIFIDLMPVVAEQGAPVSFRGVKFPGGVAIIDCKDKTFLKEGCRFVKPVAHPQVYLRTVALGEHYAELLEVLGNSRGTWLPRGFREFFAVECYVYLPEAFSHLDEVHGESI